MMMLRRPGAALVVLVVTFGLAVSAGTSDAAAAMGRGAQVIHLDDVLCSVSWMEGQELYDEHCSGTNTRTPNGGYTLVLHGQIPDLTEFDGPTSFATTCGVNYFFWRAEIDETFVFTASVRHFTADGRMTETCTYTPTTDPG